LVIFLTYFLVISCTERIEIKLDDSYVRLSVEGTITTDTMEHTVTLSKSTSYFYNETAPGVRSATVSITDGVSVYDMEEVFPGVYRTGPTVFGVVGNTYTLNIKLADQIGGFTEYSASSKLFPVTQLDSIDLLYNTAWSSDGVWEVKCFMQDPPTDDFYRFVILKNGSMVTDTLDEWFVTDDRFINGNYTYGATIAYLDQGSGEEGLVPGDTITVEMNSIGKEYANFLWAAQSELRGSNPLFSGPPSNVDGNINNGAFGFFAAYSVSRSYTVTPPF